MSDDWLNYRLKIAIYARLLVGGETRKAFASCSMPRDDFDIDDTQDVVDLVVNNLAGLGSFKSNDLKVKIGFVYVGDADRPDFEPQVCALLYCKRDAIPYQKIHDLCKRSVPCESIGDVTDTTYVPDDNEDWL